MALFELLRIWDAWPNLYNHQILRDLFRQASSPSDSCGRDSGSAVNDIFVIPGHLFVTMVARQQPMPEDAIDSNNEHSEGRAQLYAFSRVPLRAVPKSPDSHVTPYLLPISDKCQKIIKIFDFTNETRQRILVVLDNGTLMAFEYNTDVFTWERKDEVSISEYLISDAVVHCHTLVYCSRPHKSHDHSSQVSTWTLEVSADGSLLIGDSKPLLTASPELRLVSFRHGVSFLPTANSAYPRGLLLFWLPGLSCSLKAFVWNSTHFLSRDLPMTMPISFRDIALKTAGFISKASGGPSLVAMETNSLNNNLMALASDGTLYYIALDKRGVLRAAVKTRLSDFAHRNPTIPDVFDAPLPYIRPHLFAIHTFYGYCLKGELRLYDGFTGEFVWECDDHEGAGSIFWTTPTPPVFCGLHGNSGLWLLRSHRASEHAQFMATALFPITTNADETTPGDYLDSAQLLAAKLSSLWDLGLLATKFSLEGAFDIVKAETDESSKVSRASHTLPHVNPALIEMLTQQSSLQNPALLVALLAEYPGHRKQLADCVQAFLDRYHGNSDPASNSLLTQLNSDTVPLLTEFLKISQEIKLKMKELDQPLSAVVGKEVRSEVCQLLRSSELATAPDHDKEASSRALFTSYCSSHPEDALLGIRDFLEVENFETAVEELESGRWSSNRNWRGILATESAVRVQKSYMMSTNNHLPLFEQTCRLLYHAHPEDLLPFVLFSQLARDYQAQGDSAFARKCRNNFFFVRALNALPIFVSCEATPTPKEAIQARCQLLLRSDYTDAHMSCLQLLLSNELWSEAISLVEELSSDTPSHTALFHCLLVNLAKGGVLAQYIDRVWKLVPKKFSLFDFVGVLRTAVTSDFDPLLVQPDNLQLTVDSVSSKLLQLLSQNSTEHIST